MVSDCSLELPAGTLNDQLAEVLYAREKGLNQRKEVAKEE